MHRFLRDPVGSREALHQDRAVRFPRHANQPFGRLRASDEQVMLQKFAVLASYPPWPFYVGTATEKGDTFGTRIQVR